MKKLILTFINLVDFAFTSTAQSDAQSILVTTNCGSYTCLSYPILWTGVLSVEIANYYNSGDTMRRKPTLKEMLLFADQAC